MPAAKLANELNAVNWNANVKAFLNDTPPVENIANANLRLAIWARQCERIDKGNPALCFIREMQLASHHVAAVSALSLYTSAASSMRAMLETALYYTYFRTHLTELTTLVRDPNFFISKSDVLEHHKIHTPKFWEIQKKLDLCAGLNKWYSLISSIVHGQIPGAWVEHKAISDIKYNKATLEVVAKTFCEGEDLVHRLFLCTVGREQWDYFSSPAKKSLLHGLTGDVKKILDLDSA